MQTDKQLAHDLSQAELNKFDSSSKQYKPDAISLNSHTQPVKHDSDSSECGSQRQHTKSHEKLVNEQDEQKRAAAEVAKTQYAYDLYFDRQEISKIESQQNNQIFDNLQSLKRNAAQSGSLTYLPIPQLVSDQPEGAESKKQRGRKLGIASAPVAPQQEPSEDQNSVVSLTESEKRLVEADILNDNITDMIKHKMSAKTQ